MTSFDEWNSKDPLPEEDDIRHHRSSDICRWFRDCYAAGQESTRKVCIFVFLDPGDGQAELFLGRTKEEAAEKYATQNYSEQDKAEAKRMAMDVNGPFSLWPKCTITYEEHDA